MPSLLRLTEAPRLAVTTALAALLFLGSLAAMAAIAGWSRVTAQLDPGLSFWFAVAFCAELISFCAYVLAYRSVAAAPFAEAILGVFVYRLFNLWLPLLPAAAALPHLRKRYGRSFEALPRQT